MGIESVKRAIIDNCQGLDEAYDDAHKFAAAFRLTGNEHMAKKFEALAYCVKQNSDNIRALLG